MNYEGTLQDEVGNNFYPKPRYAYIEMRGFLWRGTSFDDVARNKKSTAFCVDAEWQGNAELPGYPTGAYKYGTLITINPYQSSTYTYDIVQIYVPDAPAFHGIYFRTYTSKNWIKISGETVVSTS